MATKASAIGHASVKKRIRKMFGNIHEVVDMPNLIEVQRDSYETFCVLALRRICFRVGKNSAFCFPDP